LVRNALFHHREPNGPRVCVIALAITHVEPNGIHLQPKGLSAIAKVYGSNIFQGFLKENNLGSKLSLDQFPYILIPIPAYPSSISLSQQTCNGFLQGTLNFYYTHFLHPNINISIISGILTCFTHDMAKIGATKWCNKLQWYTRYNTDEYKSKCVEVYALIFNISNNLACELNLVKRDFTYFANVALKVFGASNNWTITW